MAGSRPVHTQSLLQHVTNTSNGTTTGRSVSSLSVQYEMRMASKYMNCLELWKVHCSHSEILGPQEPGGFEGTFLNATRLMTSGDARDRHGSALC
jgi:hypothetical protein